MVCGMKLDEDTQRRSPSFYKGGNITSARSAVGLSFKGTPRITSKALGQKVGPRMCRFLCYKGPEILLADLLYRPQNSLILQSFKARERKEPLNGDGFGVGWYSPHITPTPCVFTSLTPAWSNQNLRRLSEHVKSSCFFAHVRAASPGMRVCEANCHPFQYGRFLWMHNGTIEGFRQIKRRLRASLPDQLYNAIEGTTDSEHAFAVFLHLLGDTERVCSAREMGNRRSRTYNHSTRAMERGDEPLLPRLTPSTLHGDRTDESVAGVRSCLRPHR